MNTAASPSRAIWLFPFVFVAHNLEEALWLPEWSQTAGAFHPPVTTLQMSTAVSVLTLGAAWLTLLAQRRAPGALAMLAGVWLTMLANVLMPHVLACVVLQRYAPGLLTAVIGILPVTAYLLRRAGREWGLTRVQIAKGFALAAPSMLATIALSFWLTGG